MKVYVNGADFEENLPSHVRHVLTRDCAVIVKHGDIEALALVKASDLQPEKQMQEKIKSVSSNRSIDLEELIETFAARASQLEEAKSEISKLKNSKGHRTTEFWVSVILSAFAAVGVGTGFTMNNPELIDLGKWILAAVGVGYPIARGQAKSKQ